MAEVVVADNVLAQGEPFFENGELTGWSSSPSFLILPGDTQEAVGAVVAAAHRFASINEYGREVPDDDPDRYGYYTPSWVGVFRTGAGLAMMVDTKGDLPRVQGEAMVGVLTEELTARGVTARIDAMPRGLDIGEEIAL